MLPDAVRDETRAWVAKAENDLTATRLLLGDADPPFVTIPQKPPVR